MTSEPLFSFSCKMQDTLENDLPEYVWESVEEFDVKDFDIRAMLDDTELDLEVLADLQRRRH